MTISPIVLKFPKAIYLMPSKDKLAVLEQDLFSCPGEAAAAWKRESEGAERGCVLLGWSDFQIPILSIKTHSAFTP